MQPWYADGDAAKAPDAVVVSALWFRRGSDNESGYNTATAIMPL
jgi:hypothetical protein